MKKIMVVAPHPDDETLGCGGSLLRWRKEGNEIQWLIVTSMPEGCGYSSQKIRQREDEIREVEKRFGFSATHRLDLPTTTLGAIPLGDIVGKISAIFKAERPNVVLLPYRGDAHSDHKVVFDAVAACTKWFRCDAIGRVLAYETLSETDFGLDPDIRGFNPNVFVNISDYLNEKIEVMKVYASELGEFPFPRSEQAVRSLACMRGASSGCKAAEAFMLLRERV